MNALMAQFIPEARDLLEQAGSGLLALERDATSQEAINDVFRAVHTLKGSSGLFDLGPLTRLAHAAEDLLGEVRTGEIALNSEMVDRLLDSLDLVGVWIDALESDEALPGDAESRMAARVATMRQWLVDRSGPGDAGSGGGMAPLRAQPAPDWLIDFSEAERMAAFAAGAGSPLLAWSFTPDEDCFFRGDDPIAMLRGSPGLLAMRIFPRETLPDLSRLDPLACFLRFEALSAASRESLEEHTCYVADCVDIRAIEARDLALPKGDAAGGPVFRDVADAARRHMAAGDADALGQTLAAALDGVAAGSFQASALRWCQAHVTQYALTRPEDIQSLLTAVETGRMGERTASSPTPLGGAAGAPAHSSPALEEQSPDRRFAERLALEQIRVLQTPAHAAIVEGRMEAVAAVLKNIAKATGGDDIDAVLDIALAQACRSGDPGALISVAESLFGPGAVVPAPAIVSVAAPSVLSSDSGPGEQAADKGTANRVLRIDQSKIDSIMNLVAELIVAKNGLSYLATRAEEVHGSRAAAREIKDQFSIIDRITQGLQVGVMSVRLMPVGQVFQRFPRLVRDVSRKLGKQINLVIEGEDTEADKTVLESLADPLIHMVRNSLDHGVETPEERRACGKPEQGTVRISARQENDFVVIEVRDDGRGIDPARVKAKALKLGLISAEKAALLSDEDAANLVFAAGFSTKDEVSDLSGRGVGMDVVRSAVLRAGGDVALRTTLGAGTSVTLRLPLTMAVTRIVTIACRGRLFGIPMDYVVETVRIGRDRIKRIKAVETFVLRNAIIPIVRLADALALAPDSDEAADRDEAVMVVKLGADRVGLIVDGFRERMEVIVKPLEGVLDGLPGFSGTALLGDGRVLLILDLKEILR